MEENNYFLNLMRNGIDYADKEIGLEGIIPLPKPYYSYTLNSRPGFQLDAYTYNSNVYNVSNPINPEDWSKYDLVSGSQEEWTPDQRMNYLQNAQSTAEKIGNALVNNLVIAGTTLASNILSVPVGMFWMVSGENFIDNPVNRIAADLQERTQQALPIYRGSDYENKSLWGKMGTNVFWADLIQNLGFTEGMMASGVVFNGIGALSNIKNASWAISAINSIGEASVEAINRKDLILEERMNMLNEQFNKMLPDAVLNGTTEQLYQQYADMQKSIEDDVIKALNLIFAGNVALLTLTNQIEFGKYLDKGFDTERRFFKHAMKESTGAYREISKGLTIARGVGRAALNASTEAGEEFSQDILQKWPTSFSTTQETSSMFGDFNKFNESMFNPEKKELASNMWNGLWDAIVETVQDPNTAVDAMTGFITGLFGMPVRKMTSSGLKTQSWAGGIPGAINEAFSARTNTNEVIRQINQFISNDDETKAYYQSLVRDLVLQDEQNLALEKDDKKAYEDSKSARAINEILLYSHIGKTDELKQKIDNYLNMSDLELQQIVNEIKTKKEDGEYTIDDLKESIAKRAQYLNDKIDFIDKTKKHLLSKNPLLSDKSLESLLFLESQINDWQNRSDELTNESFESFKKIMALIDLNIAMPAGPSQSYVKNGKLFVDDSRTLRLYEPGESIVEYYIDNEGKQHKRSKAIVKQNDNGTYSIIRNPLNIKENDGTIFVADKDTLVKSDIPGQYVYVNRQVNENAFKFGVIISQDYRDTLKEIAESSVGLDTDEINEFVDNIDDIAEILKSLDNFYKQRKDVYENINKQNEVEDKKEAEVAKETTTRRERKEKDNFSSALDVKDLRKKLRESKLNDEKKKQILDSLEKDGNEVAKRYKQIEEYRNKLIGLLSNFQITQQQIDDAKSLINSGYYSVDSVNDLANPDASWLNNSLFFANTQNTLESELSIQEQANRRYVEAVWFIRNSMVLLNSEEAYRGLFDNSYRKLTMKDPFKTSEPVSPSAVMYINDEPIEGVYSRPVISEASSSTISQEIDVLQDRQKDNSPDISRTKNALYYSSSIPQMSGEQVKERDFTKTFAEDQWERSNHEKDFRQLENYLINPPSPEVGTMSAFDYINEGNLLENSEIGFMIDPTMTYNGQPIIFYVHTKDGKNQVVGVVNKKSKTNFVGLLALIDDIVKEYNDQLTEENKDSIFISAKKTRVDQIMNGNIAYSKTERSLREIPFLTKDKSGNKVSPLLAVMKNLTMVTNNPLLSDKIDMPLNATEHNGRVFYCVPTATRRYFAVPVKVKHFNESEFNILDANSDARNTSIGMNLIEQFRDFAKAKTYDDVVNVMKLIGNSLYIGNIHINLLDDSMHNRINRDSTSRIFSIEIIKEIRDDDGYTLGIGRNEVKERVDLFTIGNEIDGLPSTNPKTEDLIMNELISVFMKMNPQIQIDINKINTGRYNLDIIESDLLSTNLERGDIVNSWFTVDYYNVKENRFEKAVSPSVSELWINRLSASKNNFVDGQITDSGRKITYKDTLYYYDKDTGVIRDKDNKIITEEVESAVRLILNDINTIYEKYGGVLETSVSSNGIYKLFDGVNYRYFDIKTLLYIEDQNIINDVNRKLIEKEGVGNYIKALRLKINDNEGYIVRDDENNTVSYYDQDTDTTVLLTNSSQVINRQYTGHQLTNDQETLINAYFNDPQATIKGFLSPNQYHNGDLHDMIYNETNGLLKSLNNLFKNQLPEELKPTEDRYSTIQKRDQYFAELQRAFRTFLENLQGSENTPVNVANKNIKKFINDYFTGKLGSDVDYGMSKLAFTGFVTGFNNFVNDLNRNGSSIVSFNTTLYHKYKNGDFVYSDIDFVISDSAGYIHLVKFVLDNKSWFTNNSIHFKDKSDTNKYKQFSDERRISEELLLAKSLFESQYKTEVHSLTLIPIQVTINTKTKTFKINSIGKNEYDDLNRFKLISNPVSKKYSNDRFVEQLYDQEQKLNYTIEDIDRRSFRDVINSDTGKRYPSETPEGMSTRIESPITNIVEQPVVAKPIQEQFVEQPEIVETVVLQDLQEYIPDDINSENFDNSFDMDNGMLNDVINILGDSYIGGSVDSDERTKLYNPNNTGKKADLKHEIDVITKMLPLLSKEDKIVITDLLIKTADGKLAVGLFNDGIITLSNYSTPGTAYHEAFHFVFNSIFSHSERVSILNDARVQYGEKTDLELEEALADDFMTYMRSMNDHGIISQIKRWFDKMLNRIRVILKIQPHTKYIFYKIRTGQYADVSESNESYADNIGIFKNDNNDIRYKLLDTTKFDKLQSNIKQSLTQKGWTQQMFDSMSEDERNQAILCLGI